jgi:hypothetical protein
MKYKKTITTILGLSFLLGGNLCAQTNNKACSYLGVRLGINSSDERSYATGEKTSDIYSISGSQFAIFHERKVGNIFSFINEIHYSQQGVLLSNKIEKMQYDFSNWNVPFLCKWSFGGSNFKVHILAGAYASYINYGKITNEYMGVKDELELSGSDWDRFKINRIGYGATLGGGLSYILPNSSYIVFDCRYKHDLDFVDTKNEQYSRVLGFSLGYAYPISKRNK